MPRRPSGEIERLLQGQLDKLPELLLTNLVEKKLTDLNVPDPKRNADRLAKHILAEGGANLRIENGDDAGPDQELAIEFTDEDGEGLTAAADRFMAALPELIEKVSATTSASIFRRLKKDWPEQWAWQQSVEGPFRENLEARWGEPFTLLRMLLTVSREIEPVTLEAWADVKEVQVTAKNKGRGFQGVIKRHGFHGLKATHGVKTHHRKPGSNGSLTPARTIKGKRMPGHMGDVWITQKGLKVFKVIPEKNLILVAGSVPGATGNYVVLRPAQPYLEPKAK